MTRFERKLLHRNLVFTLLIIGSVLPSFSQEPSKSNHLTNAHPWSIKTDLLGVRSHSFSLEAEAFLFWRFSAFAQLGIIQGYRPDSHWRGGGYLGRAGLKFHLGSREATKMTGFALRAEVASRRWRASGDEDFHHQNDFAGFLGVSYTWNPFDRLMVEPCLGIGRAKSREWFSDPNLLGERTGMPNTPWFSLGKYYGGELVYDNNGNLVSMIGRKYQVSIGLLVGIRL